MIIFIIALLIICLINTKFCTRGFITDNLNKNNPNQSCVRGVFAIIIFVSHVRSYFDNIDSIFDKSAFLLVGAIGQLMVAIFFFYSGFGIMESYKASDNYFKKFPTRRFLKTLLHFDIAVILFFIVNVIFSFEYGLSTILLAFTGFTSIGNSNWFMFAIFIMYISTFVAYLCTKKNKKALPYVATIFIIIYLVVLYLVNMPAYFYDTALTFLFGMFYALFKEKIENSIFKSNKKYLTCLGLSVMVFLGLYILKFIFNPMQIVYNLLAISFCFVIVLLTYKIQLNNKILQFLGKYSFNIYILQRLPMRLLAMTALINYHVLFSVVSLFITLILAILFNYICGKIDKLLWRKEY